MSSEASNYQRQDSVKIFREFFGLKEDKQNNKQIDISLPADASPVSQSLPGVRQPLEQRKEEVIDILSDSDHESDHGRTYHQAASSNLEIHDPHIQINQVQPHEGQEQANSRKKEQLAQSLQREIQTQEILQQHQKKPSLTARQFADMIYKFRHPAES